MPKISFFCLGGLLTGCTLGSDFSSKPYLAAQSFLNLNKVPSISPPLQKKRGENLMRIYLQERALLEQSRENIHDILEDIRK